MLQVIQYCYMNKGCCIVQDAICFVCIGAGDTTVRGSAAVVVQALASDATVPVPLLLCRHC